MISNSCSLSLSLTWESFSSLTHAPQWVSVCVINRESHSLFIFFCSLNFHSNKSASLNNYLPGPTSLGESKTIVPHNYGDFPLRSIRRVNLDTNVGTIAPIYNGGLTSMNLHDLLHYWVSQSEHQGRTWLNYIIDTSWKKHRGTIHKIYKWIHSEVTITST